MYKKCFILLCFLGLSVGLFAQEDGQEIKSPELKRFSIGAGFNLSSSIEDGPALDFGFLLYQSKNREADKNWDLRNNIMLKSFSFTNTNDIFILSEKISFGTMVRNGLFHFYDYVEGGIGFYTDGSKALYTTPLAFNFGGGFGLDILLHESVGVFIEAGYLGYMLDTKYSGGTIFQTGIRLFF
ncbi:hypothetical protein FACS1894142_7530 [Spirochaetia bacterium]|nr:hypothetical protein FACS1894142_7530 [Spirochaetia bacterium]